MAINKLFHQKKRVKKRKYK
jgi:hypothetical protein